MVRIKSPMRVFLVQDILDGKLIEEKNCEFVDENFVHNANDLNISSVLGGVQLTWKTFENELPTRCNSQWHIKLLIVEQTVL